MNILRSIGFFYIVSLIFTANTLASVIVSPINIINNSLGEFPGYSDDRMIDQSGLSTGFTSGVTDFDTYISTNPTHLSTNSSRSYASPISVTSGVIDFDLGSIFTVNDFVMWGDNSLTSTSRGPKDFALYASMSSDFSGAINLGSFTSATPPIPTNIPAEVFSFAATSARYIRLEIINSHGDGNNINIGEIAVSAIPIPAAAWLFGSGLLGLIGIARRKKT